MDKKIKDPGLGNVSSERAERMINTNGSFNISHLNKPRKFSEAYNFLVNISLGYFFVLTFLTGFLINAFFALIYLLIGVGEIIPSTGNIIKDFFNAFFFSTQTFTTVGYGSMYPHGFASGIISSIEAFLGLMLFAFVTGLIYGRFSKPKAAIRFSEKLVYNELNNTKSLMFRIVNNRKSTMINPKASITLSLSKKNNFGDFVNEFYALKLQRNTINYLPTTWTIVHEIEKESPLFQFSKEELTKLHGELLIMITYYDESFNQEVHQMYSYILNKVVLDYKFAKAYYYNESGKMILDHKIFDKIESMKS